MIDVYTADTPNGVKIPIALEEIGAPYKVMKIDLAAGEQKRPDFLKVNPNGRIPAIIDHRATNGASISVFESGAILVYLAEKYRKLIPPDLAGRVRALEWTFFQVGGVGPMFGQAGVFRRHSERLAFAVERYERESQRLMEVLELGLAREDYLAGPHVSIADIAHFGWIDGAERYAGVDLSALPNVSRWRERLRARSAFKRGVAAVR
jgi:glutathione S-transferase